MVLIWPTDLTLNVYRSRLMRFTVFSTSCGPIGQAELVQEVGKDFALDGDYRVRMTKI